MPFNAHGLSQSLTAQIHKFVASHDFPQLYRSYAWEKDTHAAGFPDILALEKQLRASDCAGGVSEDDGKNVARWGRLPGAEEVKAIVSGTPLLPPLALGDGAGHTQPSLQFNITQPLIDLDASVSGLGPTYKSKVLRFGCPEDYGSIDTRLVRVFGGGDSDLLEHEKWVDLEVNPKGRRAIGRPAWKSGYAKWINILREICHLLNAQSVKCPHPERFYEADLRRPDMWYCADVEMTLFAYATRYLGLRKIDTGHSSRLSFPSAPSVKVLEPEDVAVEALLGIFNEHGMNAKIVEVYPEGDGLPRDAYVETSTAEGLPVIIWPDQFGSPHLLFRAIIAKARSPLWQRLQSCDEEEWSDFPQDYNQNAGLFGCLVPHPGGAFGVFTLENRLPYARGILGGTVADLARLISGKAKWVENQLVKIADDVERRRGQA